MEDDLLTDVNWEYLATQTHKQLEELSNLFSLYIQSSEKDRGELKHKISNLQTKLNLLNIEYEKLLRYILLCKPKMKNIEMIQDTVNQLRRVSELSPITYETQDMFVNLLRDPDLDVEEAKVKMHTSVPLIRHYLMNDNIDNIDITDQGQLCNSIIHTLNTINHYITDKDSNDDISSIEAPNDMQSPHEEILEEEYNKNNKNNPSISERTQKQDEDIKNMNNKIDDAMNHITSMYNNLLESKVKEPDDGLDSIYKRLLESPSEETSFKDNDNQLFANKNTINKSPEDQSENEDVDLKEHSKNLEQLKDQLQDYQQQVYDLLKDFDQEYQAIQPISQNIYQYYSSPDENELNSSLPGTPSTPSSPNEDLLNDSSIENGTKNKTRDIQSPKEEELLNASPRNQIHNKQTQAPFSEDIQTVLSNSIYEQNMNEKDLSKKDETMLKKYKLNEEEDFVRTNQEMLNNANIKQLIDNYTSKMNEFQGECDLVDGDIKRNNIGTYLAILQGIEQDLIEKCNDNNIDPNELLCSTPRSPKDDEIEKPFDSISDLENVLRNKLKQTMNDSEQQSEDILTKKYIDEIAKLKNLLNNLTQQKQQRDTIYKDIIPPNDSPLESEDENNDLSLQENTLSSSLASPIEEPFSTTTKDSNTLKQAIPSDTILTSLEYTFQSLFEYLPDVNLSNKNQSILSINPFDDSILFPHDHEYDKDTIDTTLPFSPIGSPLGSPIGSPIGSSLGSPLGSPLMSPKHTLSQRRWTVANQDFPQNVHTQNPNDSILSNSMQMNESFNPLSPKLSSMANRNDFVYNPVENTNEYDYKPLFEYKNIDMNIDEDPELEGSQKDIYKDMIDNKLKKNIKPILQDLQNEFHNVKNILENTESPISPLLESLQYNMNLDPSLKPIFQKLLEICHQLKDLLNNIKNALPKLLLKMIDTLPRLMAVYDTVMNDIINERVRIVKELEEKHQILSYRKIRVYLRVRPPVSNTNHFNSLEVLDTKNLTIYNENVHEKRQYHFLRVFDMDSTQSEIFKNMYGSIENVLKGKDLCYVFYGQIDSGKLYTLFGTETNKGLLWYIASELYKKQSEYNQEHNNDKEIKNCISCSLVEVYDEKVKDLMYISDEKRLLIQKNKNNPRRIKELVKSIYDTIKIRSIGDHVYLEKLTQKECKNADECWTLYNNYLKKREDYSFIDGNMNEGHQLFIMNLFPPLVPSVTRITFVNLAGTSRVQTTQSTRITAAKHINKSLSCFANVINALEEGKKFIPFRDSILTQILRPVFLAGTQLSIFGFVEPSQMNLNETCDTLDFVTRIRKIKIGEEAYNRDLQKIEDMQIINEKMRKQEESIKGMENKIRDYERQIDDIKHSKDKEIHNLKYVNKTMKDAYETELKQFKSEYQMDELRTQRRFSMVTPKLDTNTTALEARIKELERENQSLKTDYEAQIKKEKDFIGRVL